MATVKLAKAVPKFQTLHVLDPGGTTGYSRIGINYAQKEIEIEEIDEFPTWSKLEHIVSLCMFPQLEGIVYESFQIRKLEANLIPVEVIGVLRYLCLKHGINHYPQTPACQGRLKGQDAIVERWYPQLKKFTSHHSSAIRHGVYFAVTKLTNEELWPVKWDNNKLQRNFSL